MTAELESPGPAGPGVAPGGNVGDALVKTGAGDFQTGWAARLALGVASALALSSVAAAGVSVAAAHEDHVHPAVAVAAAPGDVALIARAAASATANVQEWRDSTGVAQAAIGTAGQVRGSRFTGTTAQTALVTNYDTGGLGVVPNADASKGLVIRRNSATQSAELLEVQDETGAVMWAFTGAGAFRSSGTVGQGVMNVRSLADVNATGAYLATTTDASGMVVNTRSAANRGLVVKATASQAANLFEAQDSTGAYGLRIAADASLVVGSGGSVARLTVYPAAAGAIAAVVKGLTSQTGDLTQWQDVSGNVLASITGAGALTVPDPSGTGGHRIGGVAAASTELTVDTRFATFVGLAVRARSAQTNDIAQWQTSAGTVQSSVSSAGELTSIVRLVAPSWVDSSAGSAKTISLHTAGYRVLTTGSTTTDVALAVQGTASQAGDLQQWLSSSSSILARVDAAGVVYGTNLRTISSHVILQNENSGGVMWMDKSTAQAATPAGGGSVKVFVRDGTNAGTLKLVALGPGGVQVTIVDNIA